MKRRLRLTLMANTTNRNNNFISGDEATQIFAKRSGVDLTKLPITTKLKAWPGVCYGIYQYEDGYKDPILIDKLVLSYMGTGYDGPIFFLVSVVSSSNIRVTVDPVRIFGINIAVSLPQRLMFERSIQDFGNGGLKESVASCIQIHHKAVPNPKHTGVPFMELWNKVKKKFSSENALIVGLDNLQQEVVLL